MKESCHALSAHNRGAFMNTSRKADAEKTLFLRTLPVRIVIPVALTILLFVLTIFLLIIPLIEKNMMDDKRESIMHLTDSAWSILRLYHSRYLNGEISEKAAQQSAVEHIKHLRYGPEQQDYFWINTMVPVMVMHPYRPDLEGKDISQFKDPAGKKLFTEMVGLVEKNKSGFVDYLWQWKSDPSRIVPKISYVRGFEPWGWVVGTGIYVEDVREQISSITRHLTYTCLMIMALFISLSGYVIWRSVKVKKAQIQAIEKSRLREKQLIQADKMTSLGILVAGVAHEINNPATALMLNAPNLKKAWAAITPVMEAYYTSHPDTEFCSMPYPELSHRITSMLSGIEDGSARIKQIISELKDFSKPTTAVMDEVVDLDELVQKSVDLMQPHLKKATRHLHVHTAPVLPKVRGNFQKLQQVMINLLLNACQALDSQEESIDITTRADDQAGTAILQVSDTGRGMNEKDLPKITEPFFTTKRDDGGTGLGLSISEKIVSDHDGVLEFQSAPGRGLTAKIILPVIDQTGKRNNE